MSLVVLTNGQRFDLESPAGLRDGFLRQRERKILPLTFRAPESKFNVIKKAFADPTNTETIRVYFPENETASKTDAELEGVAHEDYEGFTILGDVGEVEKVIKEGTPTTPPEYGRQLTIEMGQRQFGE